MWARAEVAQLNEAMTLTTTHLHRMRAQRDALAAAVAEQTQRQRPVKAEAHRASTAHNNMAQATTKINLRLDKAAEDLFAKVKDLFALIQLNERPGDGGDGKAGTTATPSPSTVSSPPTFPAMFLFQDAAGLGERLRAEEMFTHKLTLYVKKLFKDSFVSLAAGSDASDYGLVDVATTATPPSCHSDSYEQYQIHRQELLRLRAVDAMTTENLSRARIRLAQRSTVLQALQGLVQKCEENRMEAMAVLK